MYLLYNFLFSYFPWYPTREDKKQKKNKQNVIDKNFFIVLFFLFNNIKCFY